MRLIVVLATVAVAASLVGGASAASTPAGFGSAACLRGNWVANRAETNRVVHALVPVSALQVTGRLYMIFRGGNFQYGSTGLVIGMDLGDADLTASGRFFSLSPYTARTGRLTLGAGESTVEFDDFKATKNGRTYTMPGPAPTTRSIPGGATAFQCRAGTLKVRLPRFASLNWITLQRGTP